jgi:predicted nucleic acid-binding protein
LILVDTNVVSETMRQVPDAGVVAWLDAQMVQNLYLSAISLAELMAGHLRAWGVTVVNPWAA